MSSDTSADTYQSSKIRAICTAGLLGLCAVLLLCDFVSNWMQVNLVETAGAGVTYSQAQLEANDLRVNLIASALSVSFIATYVMYCFWFHRVCRNAEPLGQLLEYTPGRAVGNWFIPFVNLLEPYRTVLDLWESSALPGQADSPPILWLGIWWACWLMAQGLGRIAYWLRIHVQNMADFASASRMYMVSDVPFLAAALLTAWTVVQITRRQDALHLAQRVTTGAA